MSATAVWQVRFYMRHSLLVVLACVVTTGCSGSTEPSSLGTGDPFGRYTLTDSLAGDKTVNASGGTITFAADKSYVWDMNGVHRAGHWARPTPDQIIVSDTTPTAFIGIWFATLTGSRLTLRTANDFVAYGFKGP